ncbi:PLD nuclease N-terminal domain-containing protein [Pseudomonas caspiana]
MEITLFGIGVLLIVLLIDIWLLVNISRSSKGSSTKIGWALLILLLPVVGWVIWGITGPRGVTRAPSSPEHSKG